VGTGNHRLPDKKDVARGLLLRGSVFVHLDPRVDGVVVPSYLRKQPQLVLQVGLDMPIPIPDLRVDDDGVFGTLSFNRSPFTVLVPWDAVYAVADDEGRAMVWPASLPDELRAEVEREMGLRPPQKGLRVVDGGVEDDADTDAEAYAGARMQGWIHRPERAAGELLGCQSFPSYAWLSAELRRRGVVR